MEGLIEGWARCGAQLDPSCLAPVAVCAGPGVGAPAAGMRRHARRRLPALAALLELLLLASPAESRLVHDAFPSSLPDVFLGTHRPVKETPRLSDDLEPFLPVHRRVQDPSTARRKPLHSQEALLQLSSTSIKPGAESPSPISSHFFVTERLSSGVCNHSFLKAQVPSQVSRGSPQAQELALVPDPTLPF